MRKLSALLLLIIVVSTTQAQQWKFIRHEVSGGVGATSFLGELGGSNNTGSHGIKGIKDLEFKMTRPVLNVGYRYFFTQWLAGGANLAFGRLNGSDELTDEIYRKNRNLHFKSPIVELSVRAEIYPFKEYFGHLYRSNGVLGKSISHFSPYLFVGVGGFYFNPKAKYDGSWQKLRALETEGTTYKRIAMSFPVGAGVKYALSNRMSIGFEIGLRYTTTDYIDDVSGNYVDKSGADAMTQYLANPTTNIVPVYVDGAYTSNPTAVGQQRGNSEYNDSYAFAIFSVNYKLTSKRMNLPKF